MNRLKCVLVLSMTAAALGCGGAEPSAAVDETKQAVTLSMDKTVLKPGEELFFCQDFQNPFGEDVEIVQFDSTMSEGAHHFLAFAKPGATNTKGTSCGEAQLGALIYDSQNKDGSQRYPEGVAMPLSKDTGIQFNTHFLNTTGKDIEISTDLVIHLAKPGDVVARAGALMFGNGNIDIAPGAEQTVSWTCQFPVDMKVNAIRPHMHQWGIGFRVDIEGKEVYTAGSSYDAKAGAFDPGLDLKAGQGMTFACTYRNTTANPLGFSFSAADGEMCALFGSFYPVPDGVDPLVFCGP